jgi:hypothetical protein
LKELIQNPEDLAGLMGVPSPDQLMTQEVTTPAGYKLVLKSVEGGLIMAVPAMDFNVIAGPYRLDYPFIAAAFLLRVAAMEAEAEDRVTDILCGGDGKLHIDYGYEKCDLPELRQV